MNNRMVLCVAAVVNVMIATAVFGESEILTDLCDDEWIVFRTSSGKILRARQPRDPVCVPLLPVDDSEEESARNDPAARDAASMLEQCFIPNEIVREVEHYGGARWFRCIFDDHEWEALLFSPRDRLRRLPVIVLIPGRGEIGGRPIRLFNQRGIYDVVLSEKFQEKHPCHLLVLSPPEMDCNFCGCVAGTPNPAQRRAELLVRRIIRSFEDPDAIGCFTDGIVPGGDYAMADTNRVYLTGYSYGGDAVIRVAMAHPGEFAAVVPISSGVTPPEFVSETHPGNFWYACNDGDGVGSGRAFNAVKTLQERVNKFGGDFRISVYPATSGHDAWNAAWNEESIWDWMFSKSLSAPVKKVKQMKQNVNAKRSSASLADAKCSSTRSSVDEEHDETRPLDGLARTYFEPSVAFSRDDWWQVELRIPVAGCVRVETGDESGERLLKAGYVEISGNGRTWRRGGGFSKESGTAEFKSQTPFKFIRVRSIQGPRKPFVIRQLQVFSL